MKQNINITYSISRLKYSNILFVQVFTTGLNPSTIHTIGKI